HHEWAPGNHTLFLAGRLEDTLRVNNPNYASLVRHESGGQVSEIFAVPLLQNYRSEVEIYSAEAQQIFQREQQAVIVGARYQGGEFRTRNENLVTGFLSPFFAHVPPQNFANDFERVNFYGYYHLQLAEPSLPVHLIA